MRLKSRSEMRPGEMFVYRNSPWSGYLDVLVVVDRVTEIGFWNGGLWRTGDVMPSVEFEVIA